MKVETCKNGIHEVRVQQYCNCTFVVIDSWDEGKYPKTCDVMYVLSNHSGGYIFDGEKWQFISFTGGVQQIASDWGQTEQTAPDYIKNKPFQKIGVGLEVENNILKAEIQKQDVTSVNKQKGDVILKASDVGALGIDEAAKKANKLTTAHQIAGHVFDGTQDIEISASDIGVYSKSEVDKKIKEVIINKEETTIDLGCGLKGTITKIGQIITFFVHGNQTSNRSDGHSKVATIATEYRPVGYVTVKATVLSPGIETGDNQRFFSIEIQPDGNVYIWSVRCDASPITLCASTTWSNQV